MTPGSADLHFLDARGRTVVCSLRRARGCEVTPRCPRSRRSGRGSPRCTAAGDEDAKDALRTSVHSAVRTVSAAEPTALGGRVSATTGSSRLDRRNRSPTHLRDRGATQASSGPWRFSPSASPGREPIFGEGGGSSVDVSGPTFFRIEHLFNPAQRRAGLGATEDRLLITVAFPISLMITQCPIRQRPAFFQWVAFMQMGKLAGGRPCGIGFQRQPKPIGESPGTRYIRSGRKNQGPLDLRR